MTTYVVRNRLVNTVHEVELIAGFIKWSLVILLLLIPSGPILVTIFGLILGITGGIKRSDLFFLFFLSGFVNGALDNYDGYSMLRYLILLPLIINSRSNILIRKVFTIPVLIFSFYLVAHGLLISPNPMFSLLNAGTAILTIVAGFAAIYSDREEGFWPAFQSICIAVAFWSLISIPFPEFSYARNGVGLQGVGTHPNLFAVFLAPLCFYAFARLLIRPRFVDVLLFILLFTCLFLSQSRTSIFSVILSLIVYTLFAQSVFQKYAKRGLLLFIPFLIISIIYAEPISDFLLSILTKGGGGTISFLESVERSRGALFLAQLQNILSNPFLGIGFKILSSGEANSFFEASATGNAYEKGVFIMALIEETGFIGAILFLVVLYSMLTHILTRSVSSVAFYIPVCFLFTTFGEATLLSIGSIGPLIWASIAYSKYSWEMGEK